MRNKTDSVTVLMPVYNGRSYLEEAVESIQRQTHGDFEFLIVDDGSTDGSGEIGENRRAGSLEFASSLAHMKGVAAAGNRALALTT
jgi:glycosyltransferase involved in cell wall biosynthesis